MGKSKLTGSRLINITEIIQNRKQAARDKSVKKAIELALDLSGATNYAIKKLRSLRKDCQDIQQLNLHLDMQTNQKNLRSSCGD